MIRLTLILMLLAAPALAQTQQPVPRPDDLGQRRAPVVEVAVAPAPVVAEAALDRAAIASQITGAIRNCWNIDDLSDAAMAVSIWLAFDTTPEGEVVRSSIEMIEFSGGTQEAADEALGPAFRAIMRCGADGLDLPEDTHAIWQRVEVQFEAASVAAQ